MDFKRIKKARWNLESLGQALDCHWGYSDTDFMIHDTESFIINEGNKGTFNIVNPFPSVGTGWKIEYTEKFSNIDYVAKSKYGYLIYLKDGRFIGINPLGSGDNLVSVQQENRMKNKEMRIKEEVKIPGTDIVLEKGDRIIVKEKTMMVHRGWGNETEEIKVYDSVPKKWELWVGFERDGVMGIGYAGDPSNRYQLTEIGVLSTKFTPQELKLLSLRACTGLGFRRPEQYERLKKLKRNANPRYQKILDEAYRIMTTKIKWD